MNFYNKVEKFVVDAFEKSGDVRDMPHLQRTVYWVKQLKLDADEALLIAAIAHDIERAFRDESYLENLKHLDKGFVSESHVYHHSNKGAEIITEFLEKQDAPKELIERVAKLIQQHEIGGDEDSDILKDADCISFFENNAELFLQRNLEKIGERQSKDKMDYMFDKISSDKAKTICRKWYDEIMKKIN